MIFVFSCEILYPTIASEYTSKTNYSTGNLPVSEIADGMVDQHTGDFRYSVPILSVPGPNGENVPISANYSAGIRMNQKASWIGLGWDYNPGEISRQIIGAPDDYSGQPISINENLNLAKFTRNNFTFGPFNFEKVTGFTASSAYTSNSYYNTGMYVVSDFFALPVGFEDPSNYNKPVTSSASWYPHKMMNVNNAYYKSPGYDKYQISGPGIYGNLKPFIFEGIEYYNKIAFSGVSNVTYNNTKKKTQFYFDNSTDYTVNNSVTDPNNRVKSGYFIKYYYNNEINNQAKLFNNSTQTGFLDYRIYTGSASNRRSSTDYDLNGIGGIEVTNPNGLTFHYSLPVYSKEKISKTFETNDNLISLTASNSIKKSTIVYTPEKYATSWKLTAITGPDYFDSNNNKCVDQGDIGYWVAYKYSKWQDDFFNSNSYYNYSEDFGGLELGFNKFVFGGIPPNPIFTKNYNITSSKSQVYYLDYIQTASHTAFFIKNYRNDEHSYNLGTNTKVPLLKLDRIVLMKNENAGVLLNSSNSWNLTNLNSNFNAGSFNNCESSLMHHSKYLTNKTVIDNNSLISAEFKTDYSLCRKLYNNIENTATTTSINPSIAGSAVTFYNSINNGTTCHFNFFNFQSNSVTSSNYEQSGKLTLNEIVIYNDKAKKVFPSFVFSYDKQSSDKNPDYNPLKADYWGYYKNDYVAFGSSHYTTPESSAHVDAWSLKEILTPVGSKIKVTYETDDYEREGYSDQTHPGIFNNFNNNQVKTGMDSMFGIGVAQKYKINRPSIIIPIRSSNYISGSTTYEFVDYNVSPPNSNLSNFIGSGHTNYVRKGYLNVIPFRRKCDCSSNNPPCPSNQETLMLFTYGYYVYKLNIGNFNGIYTNDGNLCTNYGENHLYTPYYMSGYAMANYQKMPGGGVRVKEIELVDESNNESYIKEYEYEDGYAPVVPKPLMSGGTNHRTGLQIWLNYNNQFPYVGNSKVGYTKVTCKNIDKFSNNNGKQITYYNNSLIKNPLIANVAKIPNTIVWGISYAPTNYCSPNGGSDYTSLATFPNRNIYNFQTEFKNNESKSLGKINKVESYTNDNVLLNSTQFYYKADHLIREYNPWDWMGDDVEIPYLTGATHYSQGNVTISCVYAERYNFGSFSENYNIVLNKTVSKDYSGGSEIEKTNYFEYDPNTLNQRVVKTVTKNEGVLLSNKVYANENSLYSGLGFKCDNENNKNMLAVLEKSGVTKYAYGTSMQSNANGFILGEQINSYKKTISVLKFDSQNQIYHIVNETKNWHVLDETKNRIVSNDQTINPWSQANYRVEGKTSLFNIANKTIETEGLNGRKSSIKYGYNHSLPLAGLSSGNYNSFTFSGFEDTITVAPGVIHFGGEVYGGNNRSSTMAANNQIIKPHSGYYFSKIEGNTQTLFFTRGFEKSRSYTAKLWVHKNSNPGASLIVSLSNFKTGSNSIIAPITYNKLVSSSDNITVGDWKLLSIDFDLPANAVGAHGDILISFSSTSASYIDDFKFHPLDEPIVGNVYDFRNGNLIATLNTENYATFYNYDAAGRLINQFQETKNFGNTKIMENLYNNSRQ